MHGSMTGRIDARIDSANKVVYARSTDQRNADYVKGTDCILSVSFLIHHQTETLKTLSCNSWLFFVFFRIHSFSCYSVIETWCHFSRIHIKEWLLSIQLIFCIWRPFVALQTGELLVSTMKTSLMRMSLARNKIVVRRLILQPQRSCTYSLSPTLTPYK